MRLKEKLKKESGSIILFVGLHLFLFALGSLFIFISGDVLIYFRLGSNILEGKLPYKDFIAYPPFSLILFLLPRIFTSDFLFYSLLFTLEMFFINLIGLFFIIKLAQYLNYQPEIVLTIYTICLVLLVPIVTARYDLFPAILTFLAFYTFFRGQRKISWVLLALGTLAKIYPLFLAPLFALFQLQSKNYKDLFRGSLIFLLLLIIPWLIFTPTGLIAFLKAQINRHLQIETLDSSLLLVANLFGFWPLEKELEGSLNVRSPVADFLAKISPFFFALGLLVIYWIYFRDLKRDFQTEKNQEFFLLNFPFINYILVIILISLLLNKVFSPQFLLWLCPFVPFIKGRWRSVSILIFILVSALTTYIYPFNYFRLYKGEALPTLVLLLRNLLLASMVYFLLQWKSSNLPLKNFSSKN